MPISIASRNGRSPHAALEPISGSNGTARPAAVATMNQAKPLRLSERCGQSVRASSGASSLLKGSAARSEPAAVAACARSSPPPAMAA
jgi:hypothetical protein